MNTTKAGIAIAISLIVGVSVGVWWSHKSSTSVTTNNDRKVLYWHDPMVPNQKFDKPGKSPFMDMQLVPVFANQDSNDAGVKVSSSVTQSLGIRLGKVEKGTLDRAFTATGNVVYDESLVRLVQSRVAGYVTKLNVKAPMQQVQRGAAIAEITSPEWLEAQQEYVALLTGNSPSAIAMRTPARERLRLLDVPEGVIAAIEKTHEVKPSIVLVSPIDGVLSELAVREGASFAAGSLLFKLNGIATVWINAQVPEAQLHAIPIGAQVSARTAAWPGESFDGRVQALLPEVDAASRVFTVRTVFENKTKKLSPGMFVSIEFVERKGAAQLLVPTESVIMTGKRNVVLQQQSDGSFKAIDVVIGGQAGGKTVITKGLSEGDSIVLSGQFLIDSEASLTSTIDRLTSSGDAGKNDGTGQVTQHLGEGTITEITPAAVTISHGPIPSLKWEAMTMTFKSPSKGIPSELKQGDRVSFSFSENNDGAFELNSIVPLGKPTTGSQAETRP